MNDHFLSQCNFAPSRTVNGTANILDVLLTTSPRLISNIEVIQDGLVSGLRYFAKQNETVLCEMVHCKTVNFTKWYFEK